MRIRVKYVVALKKGLLEAGKEVELNQEAVAAAIIATAVAAAVGVTAEVA